MYKTLNFLKFPFVVFSVLGDRTSFGGEPPSRRTSFSGPTVLVACLPRVVRLACLYYYRRRSFRRARHLLIVVRSRAVVLTTAGLLPLHICLGQRLCLRDGRRRRVIQVRFLPLCPYLRRRGHLHRCLQCRWNLSHVYLFIYIYIDKYHINRGLA